MPGLKLQVTNAGRAALVNAPNTGTNAVLVSQVGIASAPFTSSPELIALPNEIKRLDTVGGTISAADTVHVSVRDESTAVYDCYGFGLYLSDGTLFAVYSQPTLLLGKAAAAMMLLALDAIFADIDVQQLTFGDTNFTDPAATTELPGIVELATEQEATAGSDKVRAITAWLLKKVLDARLGVGAPSEFAKTLLGLATAALFRSSLEIKSAALKDEGADNGLDADKLDGQHGAWYRQWANLTGVPATATAWPTWDQVQSKPATFPPSAHPHADYVQKAGDTMTGPLVTPSVRVYEAGASNQLFFRKAGDVMTIDSVNITNTAWAPLIFTSTGFTFNGGATLFQGTITSANDVRSNTNFLTTNGYWVASTSNGQCTLLFRPNGVGNTLGQMALGTAGTLDIAGACHAAGGFDIASSLRLKDVLGPMPYGLEQLELLDTVTGRYKPKYNEDGRDRLFLIAEQLLDLMPETVDAEGATIATLDAEGMPIAEEKFPSIKIDQLMPVFVRAFQQVSGRIRDLQAEVTDLRNLHQS
ncbi:MAG TPA: hypothetical protein VD865_07685 [Stenotrophomonas sp.]|nr:hypothetical protein [Stenotrophomonas sp.]